MRNAVFAPALLAVAIGLSQTAAADQKDPSLTPLFKYLKTATRADDAGAVEDKIWEIWSETGDPMLDKLMAQSADAMDRSDFSGALEDVNQIVAKKPDFAEGWNKRATIHYLTGEYEKALSDIDRALELEPRHFGALSGLGLTNMKLGNDAAAVDAFQRLLEIDPLYPNAQLNLQLARNALKRNSI